MSTTATTITAIGPTFWPQVSTSASAATSGTPTVQDRRSHCVIWSPPRRLRPSRPGRRPSQPTGAGGASSALLLPQCGLEPLHLALQLPRVAGPDVRLEHEGDATAVRADRLGGAFHHVEHLVPLPLEGREHRVGVVRQAGL